VIFFSADDFAYIAERAMGATPVIRDIGLLESASVRPGTSWQGADAYPTIDEKAAALVHSLVSNHALVDGNKRLGLAGLIAFLGVNGWRLTWTNDEAYEFIMQISSGHLDDIASIAARTKRARVGRSRRST
jgi:death on curing protein